MTFSGAAHGQVGLMGSSKHSGSVVGVGAASLAPRISCVCAVHVFVLLRCFILAPRICCFCVVHVLLLLWCFILAPRTSSRAPLQPLGALAGPRRRPAPGSLGHRVREAIAQGAKASVVTSCMHEFIHSLTN